MRISRMHVDQILAVSGCSKTPCPLYDKAWQDATAPETGVGATGTNPDQAGTLGAIPPPWFALIVRQIALIDPSPGREGRL
jgi:hypothetical protein